MPMRVMELRCSPFIPSYYRPTEIVASQRRCLDSIIPERILLARAKGPMPMKISLITNDPDVVSAALEGFHPSDKTVVYESWQSALDSAKGVDLMFVDMLATLQVPHEIAGYEEFGIAKIEHAVAAKVPTVLISPPPDYKLDFMVGWPEFLVGNIQRPVSAKVFRRASTWV